MIVDNKECSIKNEESEPVSMEVTEVGEANDVVNDMKESILDSVAESDGFFKSQQNGEKDLTFSEKRDIAKDLLSRNIPLFLQRYWKFIKIEDVDFFCSDDNYEVNFYVGEIKKYYSARPKNMLTKNRRYEAMKRLVKEGSYFSDVEMKKRNPYLYDQLIGQYLTEKERIANYQELHKNDKFSTFLMGQFDRNEENCLFNEQKKEDDDEMEEEKETDESEESELEDDEPKIPIVTKQEQILLRNEFTNIMYESFLAGKDKDFDYSSVDYNDEYDSVEQRNLDEEEKYFDED